MRPISPYDGAALWLIWAGCGGWGSMELVWAEQAKARAAELWRSLIGELNCSTKLSKPGQQQRGFGSRTKAKAAGLWSGNVLEGHWGSLGVCSGHSLGQAFQRSSRRWEVQSQWPCGWFFISPGENSGRAAVSAIPDLTGFETLQSVNSIS